MANFLQPTDQQDPDAIRRMMMARIFGTQPGAPSAATPPPGPAAPKPVATPTTGTESSSEAPPALKPGPKIQSEEEYGQGHPLPPHTPYQEPDLKHRMLMGIFAGLQNFGRDPGAGERMLGGYLGDIQKKTEAEKNYPQTATDQMHRNYMNYLAGQSGPLNVADLQARINDRQAQAYERLNKAKQEATGGGKLKQVNIDDPEHPGQPLIADFDPATGAVFKQGTREAILGAKQWEKAAPEKNLEKITVLGPDNKPHVYGVNAKGEKVQDFGVAPQETPGEKHSASELAQVERETRTNIRKATDQYRAVQEKAASLAEFVKEAKGGNKAAVKVVPLEGALEITTSQGVKRINYTEVSQIAGAGSLLDRISGWGGKQWSGKDIPDNVLDDIASLGRILDRTAYQGYNDAYEDEMGVAEGYGLKLRDKLKKVGQGTHAGGASGGAPDKNNPLGL